MTAKSWKAGYCGKTQCKDARIRFLTGEVIGYSMGRWVVHDKRCWELHPKSR